LAALDLAEDQLPSRLPAPLDATQRDLLKRLKKAAASMAAEWGLASEALLPAKDYELMVRLGSGEQIKHPASWGGWRAEPVVLPLLLLAGVEE
jgi:ribonuclease D